MLLQNQNSREQSPYRKFERKRICYVAGDDFTDGSNDGSTGPVVPTDGEVGYAPFVLKGRIYNNKFAAMIDSGSPVTIFTTEDLKHIPCNDELFARLLPKSEKYVNFKGQPLKFALFIHVPLKIWKQEIEISLILVEVKGRSLVGQHHEWDHRSESEGSALH